MNAVLMDTKRHKTVPLQFLGQAIEVPVEVSHRSYDVDETRTLICGWSTIEIAIFKYSGGWLFGDPIYLQTSGPELPPSWWDR